MGSPGLSLALVVTAAGRGTRFGTERPKQYVPLLGVPILTRTVSALAECPRVDALVVVVNGDEVDARREELIDAGRGKVVRVVAGAEHRALSVRNGLTALAEEGSWDLVGVHDGARPLVTCEEVERAVTMLEGETDVAGAVVALPSVDTLKEVDAEGLITATADRERIWRAQTPQIFHWQVLTDAYTAPDKVLLAATDDSALVESCGGRVKVVQGSPENLKITEPSDFRYAEGILRELDR